MPDNIDEARLRQEERGPELVVETARQALSKLNHAWHDGERVELEPEEAGALVRYVVALSRAVIGGST